MAPRRTLSLLLLAPLVHGAPLGPPATLRLVDEQRFPLAKCLDGSAPPFYFRPATSAAAKEKYFIHHMGGDFCGYGKDWGDWTEDCRKRSLGELGSSSWYAANQKTWQLETMGVDSFDADPERSPLMHDWNWVYMVYCDGHYYSGANTSRTLVPVPPPAVPPPSASKGGTAKAGDALLLQRCEPTLAGAQGWQVSPTGQLVLSQSGGLCAARAPLGVQQLQLAPCGSTRDVFSFNSSCGQVEVSHPSAAGTNTSCLTTLCDDACAIGLGPCAAMGEGNGLWCALFYWFSTDSRLTFVV